MDKKKYVQVETTILPKQLEALNILNDGETKSLAYGGGKGGGKTDLGCIWILNNCIQYPGTRWIIGRTELTKLRKSTLPSFFIICEKWGLQPDIHYTYNQQLNLIRFKWGSEIYLLDLEYSPSSPEYQHLGGIQVSGIFVDEAAEITEKCRNILSTLIRYKLTGIDKDGKPYKLLPRILFTCNPIKNHFLYNDYYKPHKDGTLPKDRKFLPALPTDNPTLDEDYLDTLRQLDPISKKRLYYGLWEYGDSNNLVDYESLYKLFNSNTTAWNYTGQTTVTLSADIARMGKDSSTILVWDKLSLVEIHSYQKQTTDITAGKINELIIKYKIQSKNVIVDADGIGGGVIDNLPRGIVSFVNNSKALFNENFQNLKTQCYFKLAELINKDELKIQYKFQDIDLRNRIMKELEHIIQDKVDSDGKLSILKKEDVKRMLDGQSPDYSDAMAFMMYNHLKSKNKSSGEYRIFSRYIGQS